MKTVFAASAVLLFAAIQSRADILAGPITNPANGHDYYLLSPNAWTASEAEAETIGGTLAIVRNAKEQDWIYTQFGSYGGPKRNLWIGLHRKVPAGSFYWVNGLAVDYTNWYSGEPNNLGGNELCVEMWGETVAPGTWNDTLEASLSYGVVEVSEKTTITENQRALVGDWYLSGRADRPCHIAQTTDALFAINEMNNTSRIICGKTGFLFAVPWQIHGEVVEDKILWSNGTWWSRKPWDYEKSNLPAIQDDLNHVTP